MKLMEMIDKNTGILKCPNPKCKSEDFYVKKQLLSNNGLAVAVVTCRSCGQIIGQLEPSSVTSNLEQINSVMNRVLPILDAIEKKQKANPSQQNMDNQQQAYLRNNSQLQQQEITPPQSQKQDQQANTADGTAPPTTL
jgi:hypothetical protein